MVELTQICVNGAVLIAGSRETPKKWKPFCRLDVLSLISRSKKRRLSLFSSVELLMEMQTLGPRYRKATLSRTPLCDMASHVLSTHHEFKNLVFPQEILHQ